ncbi:MAG: hypothetical protein U1F76_30740 [Candidatus Competibacteraceae bacterium]
MKLKKRLRVARITLFELEKQFAAFTWVYAPPLLIHALNSAREEVKYLETDFQERCTEGLDHRFNHSNQQVSNLGMWDQSRLNKKIDNLQQQWELLSEKLSGLNEQWILETRSEEKLRLRKLIDDTKAQRDQVEEQLKDIGSQLAKVGSDAKESAGRNDDQGCIERIS